MASADEQQQSGRWEWSWRRAGAGSLLAFLFACTSVSSLTPVLRVEEPSASDPAVTVQRPLAPTDAPIILGVALVIGLMLPDLKRIRIGDTEIEPRGSDTVPPDEDLAQDARELEPKGQTYLDALRAAEQLTNQPPREEEQG